MFRRLAALLLLLTACGVEPSPYVCDGSEWLLLPSCEVSDVVSLGWDHELGMELGPDDWATCPAGFSLDDCIDSK